MRILIIHDEREHLGGAETLLRELTAALQSQGAEVAWAHDRVPAAVAAFRPDFVCLMTIIVKTGLGALEWVQQSGIPHCLVLVDYWPVCHQRNMVHLAKRMLCETCDGSCSSGRMNPLVVETVNRSPVVALNPRQMKINHSLGIRTDAWLPCCLDAAFWTPDPERQSWPPRVVSSTAWSQAMYGDVWWKGEQYLRHLEKDLSITVHGITGLPRVSVRDALRTGQVYVFPSVWHESWGYCLMEAMACGLACVAFEQAGAETLLDVSSGVLIPRGDYDGLKGAVEVLLGDRDFREALGDNAARRVAEHYDRPIVGAQWLRHFEGLMERRAA